MSLNTSYEGCELIVFILTNHTVIPIMEKYETNAPSVILIAPHCYLQGGLVTAGLDVAQIWLDGTETLVNTIDREGNMLPINMIDGHALTHDPLVVLVSSVENSFKMRMMDFKSIVWIQIDAKLHYFLCIRWMKGVQVRARFLQGRYTTMVALSSSGIQHLAREKYRYH